ncbi:META domain-containing protein [Marinibaculum pumilum]|uniref:META domain-containing protein n=1 Tax=Marinibaculum pumilum TaxID=1766165 RepID=A0ABV7L8Z8_9PROT
MQTPNRHPIPLRTGSLALLAAAMLGLPACAGGLPTAGQEMPAAAAPLAGSEWQPIEIGGKAVASPPEVFLQFGSEGRVAGLGGCNRFTGSYALDGTGIAFGPLAATRMACDPPAMAREDAFLAGLAASRRYSRDGVRLVLRDEAGAVTMRLQQRDWD